MTYQEILQAEEYLKAIKGLRNNNSLNGKNYYEQAKTLDAKISSSFSSYQPKGYTWSGISYKINESDRYVDDALDVMYDCLQSLLNRTDNYFEIKKVYADIKKGKSVGQKGKTAYIVEMVTKYSDVVKFDKTVQDYIKEQTTLLSFDTTNLTDPILQGIIAKLERYADELSKGKKNPKQSSSKTTQINMIQQNMQSQTQVMNVSFEDCFKALDDCEKIDEAELKEIKDKISEIETLLKDKKGKKKTIREKISSILKWLADKTSDVMIAVLPYLLQALQNTNM